MQEYNPAAARTYGSIMLLAALSMIGPASFHQFLSETAPRHAQALDTGVAVVLLAIYALYLVFMLRTHPDFFSVVKGAEESHGPRWSKGRAALTLIAASAGAGGWRPQCPPCCVCTSRGREPTPSKPAATRS